MECNCDPQAGIAEASSWLAPHPSSPLSTIDGPMELIASEGAQKGGKQHKTISRGGSAWAESEVCSVTQGHDMLLPRLQDILVSRISYPCPKSGELCFLINNIC